ncbi:TKL protein kinase [Saprolegnia diclina VS20]|uniref:TKL protein kinase n=1 Tax=Saprolegnia diclina (strain VS20) TaxID=1156394 RepID=T0QLX4_SAPDV|nr:TKL protein kinase [Saprolegnia diclina VS20]EQC34815.1 TKL protein kinase [Saprolegnia diclina VS20]|eukprot:XP_008611687.1 TKL protein kinase [Saprolegnia diclina VS20]
MASVLASTCAQRTALFAKSLDALPSYSVCSIVKKLGDNKFDSKALQSNDCKKPACVNVLESFKTTFVGCMLTDIADVASVDMARLASYCASIDASYAPGAASPQPLPAAPPQDAAVDSPVRGGLSTPIIIAITCVVIAAIVVAGYVYLRLKRGAASATLYTSPPPMQTSNDPYASVMKHGNAGSQSNTRTSESSASNLGADASTLDLCDLDLYRISPRDVTLDKSLAQGAYGEVWLGTLDGHTVAVKKLLNHRRTRDELQKFIYEIALVAKMESRYVVQFIGVAWTRPSDMMLVTEYMDAGDLRNLLQVTASTKSFTWTKKVHVAHQIAEGLVYLHMLEPKVIHRDLKSRNVLLNAKMDAKLTDFGVSRETDDATMTAGIGTYRWMAPEVLQDGHYTESADVFSFGVILAELSNEIVPYSDLRNANGNPYTDTAIMAKVMVGELQPTFAPDCPPWFRDLGLQCMSRHHADRPTAMEASFKIQTELRLLKASS